MRAPDLSVEKQARNLEAVARLRRCQISDWRRAPLALRPPTWHARGMNPADSEKPIVEVDLVGDG
jgi:hypothetical protein